MELENQTTKQAYIQVMIEIVKKKLIILNELSALTATQEELINKDAFDEDAFIKTIDQKAEQLEELSKLDTGFEKIYDSFRDELTDHKAKYHSEIIELKENITKVTDASVRLQAMEKRNKGKLELLLTQRRKNIKSSRINSQTAAKYYQTMSQQPENQSYFYDKKK